MKLLANRFHVNLRHYTPTPPRFIDRDCLVSTKQFWYDQIEKKYSFFIAQEGSWYNLTGSVYLNPQMRENWFARWIPRARPTWEELCAAREAEQMEADIGEEVVAEIGGDTAVPSSSFGPRPRRSAAFLNDRPSSSSDHPSKAARAPRGGRNRG